MLTRIALHGLSATGYHGVFDHEREEGQRFVVDVIMDCDVDTRADDLSATLDYSVIAQTVIRLIEGEPVNLIETLAANIVDEILKQPRVVEVEVTVHKPQAPLREQFSDVTVTLKGK